MPYVVRGWIIDMDTNKIAEIIAKLPINGDMGGSFVGLDDLINALANYLEADAGCWCNRRDCKVKNPFNRDKFIRIAKKL